jgi:hypothetical protein
MRSPHSGLFSPEGGQEVTRRRWSAGPGTGPIVQKFLTPEFLSEKSDDERQPADAGVLPIFPPRENRPFRKGHCPIRILFADDGKITKAILSLPVD